MIQLRRDDRLSGSPVTLPPVEAISNRPIREAVEAYRAALAASRDAAGEWWEIQRVGLDEARGKDAEALAIALDEGRDDPGPQHARAAEEEMADLERRSSAAKVLAERRLSDLQAVLEREGEDWIASIEVQRDLAVEVWQAALDAVIEAHTTLATIEGMLGFTNSGRWWPSTTDHGVGEAIATLRSAYPVGVETPSAA